jgi:hypothetical protein
VSERFGKYVIVGKIGHGAMGEVFRARDLALNRDVALKTISGDKADDTLQRRFEREAQSAAALSHPNIITVFDFGQERGRLYMAMELLEGRDLKAALADGSLASLGEPLAIVEQIACGLAFAHENSVIHRDLKPANIHVQTDGRVKIMDFGLAKLPGSDMTRTGMVMGTPHYMSPEQARGEPADARADVFALGCILYELLTGHKAFDADAMPAVLLKVLQEEPRDVRQLRPDTPTVVVQVLESALAKKPAARFTDGGAFLAALRAARLAIESGAGDRPLASLPAPRRAGAGGHEAIRRRLALAGTLVLFVGGGLWYYRATSLPTFEATSPEQLAMARTIAATQLELAHKRFEARNYREALRHAERAAILDPQNADANLLKARARQAVADRDGAEAAARQAAAAGEHARAADALWKLMQLEPEDPAVAELSSAVDAWFEPHAEEARQELAQARQKAGFLGPDDDQESARLQREADAAARSGQWATAAARLLTARDRLARLTAGTS